MKLNLCPMLLLVIRETLALEALSAEF